LRVYLLKSILIWVDGVSAGIEPGNALSHGCFSCPHQLPCCLIETPYLCRCDPPILSILILHSLMDLVAAAKLIFLVECTDASLLSNCSAHLTEMLLCCSAFASLDQKFPLASSHFHSSISSISSTKESHNHSSKVQLNPGSRIFKPHPHVACISRHVATTSVSMPDSITLESQFADFTNCPAHTEFLAGIAERDF